MQTKLRRLTDGRRLVVIMSRSTEDRLSMTCFRGRGVQKAGNCLWNDAFELLANQEIRREFERQAVIIIDRDGADGKCKFSFEIVAAGPVGWSSTDDGAKYADDEIETFRPNKRSSGRRVRIDARRLAPVTRTMTFVCEFARQRDEWVVRIHSLYPGPDVGDLKGDLSAREGVVFFGWENPGQPLHGSAMVS